jgi:hypothetical protein
MVVTSTFGGDLRNRAKEEEGGRISTGYVEKEGYFPGAAGLRNFWLKMGVLKWFKPGFHS